MMEKRKIRSVILIGILISLILNPPYVAATKYVVEPIENPDQITDPLIDLVPAPFWSLSPHAMIIFVALMISPVLVYPVELLLTLKVVAFLGYRKIKHNAIQYNENRQLIFEAIQSNPGIYFNELSRVTGINRGTLKYHLVMLKLKTKISTLNTGGSDRYFENCGHYSDLEKILLKHMREENSRKILELVLERPDISQKEIADMIGISRPSVFWHMTGFNRAGIITVQRTGRQVQYRISNAANDILRKD
ncbi:MAG TPA: winged helix-turn-helix transcriptional regulator, partial [Bacteroidota bacterium]|nr:winged helix-turn-helix transcriptional regulator [Bacteroidota bacterium]